MSASYVLVTAAAVVLVEVAVLGIVVPRLLPRVDPDTLVQLTADSYATTAMQLGARLGRLPTTRELQLGDPTLQLRPGEARLSQNADGVRIPYTTTPQDDAQPMSLALLLDPDRRVVASSYPARYRTGDRFDPAGIRLLIAKFTGQLPETTRRGLLGTDTTAKKDVRWAVAPVFDIGALDKPAVKPLPPSDLLGIVYVQVPSAAGFPAPPVDESTSLQVGLLVLAAAVPVGLVFGLLSTRRLVGRLRRLAATTVAVADGDWRHRAREDRPRAPRRHLPGPVLAAPARRGRPQGAAGRLAAASGGRGDGADRHRDHARDAGAAAGAAPGRAGGRRPGPGPGGAVPRLPRAARHHRRHRPGAGRAAGFRGARRAADRPGGARQRRQARPAQPGPAAAAPAGRAGGGDRLRRRRRLRPGPGGTPRHGPGADARAGRRARRHLPARLHARRGHHRADPAAPMISVLIVDDHKVVRQGLRFLLDQEDA